MRNHVRMQAAQIANQAEIIKNQQARIELLEAQNRSLSESFDSISHAFFWKITKPMRFLLDVLKWLFRTKRKKGLILKGLHSLRKNGVHVTWEKAIRTIYLGQKAAQIAKSPLFSEAELERQRKKQFFRKVKFSIAVPLYNTPERFLRAMVDLYRNKHTVTGSCAWQTEAMRRMHRWNTFARSMLRRTPVYGTGSWKRILGSPAIRTLVWKWQRVNS